MPEVVAATWAELVAEGGVVMAVTGYRPLVRRGDLGVTLRAWSAAVHSISRRNGSPALVMEDSTLPTPDWLTWEPGR